MNPRPRFKLRIRYWPLGVGLLCGCWLIVPTPVAGGNQPDSAGLQSSMAFDARQAALIEARIYSRAAMVAKAMAAYERLRRDFPADTEIREAFCAFLLDHRQYEQAQHELTALLRETPTHAGAQRLQARLYSEQARYGGSVAIYDDLIQALGSDGDIWSDYAAARLGNAQWSAALNNYSRVLEADPDNRDARQMVHQILREHGPRMDLGYRRYEQLADDTTIDTFSAGWTAHLSEATRLQADLRTIDLARPQQPFVESVDGYINDVLLGLERQINQRWSVMAGIGAYGGASSDTAFTLGGQYRPTAGIGINADYQANRPWYDPVDAVELGGAYNRLQLALDWNDGRRTGIRVQGEDWRYRLDGADDYGSQQTLLGILTRRLFTSPELVVGYSYYRSWFDYDSAYRPVAMVEAQAWHTLFSAFVHRPCQYWSWGVTGGIRRDHVRRLDAWFFQPAVKLSLGNRLELDGGYEFASESTAAVGGETQTWQLAMHLYF